ncbi:hypothetical protein [Melissococcus plutonius]|uniref:Uncharacterized protein n=1 Tax=Melissococcus plutonius (strain ATCC 35311 / DSM 29964 / CIP 104052 / LMG 20360 / NCIMB 702443) TaxID=940190 RepID=F3YBJ3_MELPT|nr:hypothetical protein [Melissococcus plutonius]KMT33294.1 hypothetical protein MEPL6_1c03290 [Melissococcus plutonius]KMT33640.1 hypothetical protein MEPL8_7c00780 [Melissococcus plutonius]KMT38997.1 hypothetical protein MEPL12_5c01030 [Melissococcus plutonius]MBB5177529.1 hypothetical protein [Melissococcus plutonius]BAK21871.1 hypothetical protein MPTP_1442 [Melissococcus plutonius ATCC 35311]
MKKFNITIVFIAPLLIYTLGLIDSNYALVGVIIYTGWIYLQLDIENDKHEKRKSKLMKESLNK